MSSRRRVNSHRMQNNQICLRPLVQIMKKIWSIQKRHANYVAFPYWLLGSKEAIKSTFTESIIYMEKPLKLNQLRLQSFGTGLQQKYCTQQVHPLMKGTVN